MEFHVCQQAGLRLFQIEAHLRQGAHVYGFGKEHLDAALEGVDLLIIPAGVPRKPGMTRDDMFNINAGIVRTLCEGVVRNCPRAIVNIISNPVNSTVPIAAEVFKKAGIYDPKRLLGVTTLDVVRAITFVAEVIGVDPKEVNVHNIGGHSGITVVMFIIMILYVIRAFYRLRLERVKKHFQ